jgi:hypothetical protein
MPGRARCTASASLSRRPYSPPARLSSSPLWRTSSGRTRGQAQAIFQTQCGCGCCGLLFRPYHGFSPSFYSRFPQRASVAAGAGIAGGLFLLLLIFALAVCLGFFLGFGPSEYPLQTALSLLAFVVSSVWIVVSAVRIGKTNWPAFLMAAGATFICVAYGSDSLKSAEYRLDRQHEQRKAEHPSSPKPSSPFS